MGLSKEISQWWKYANPTPPTGSLFLQSSNKTRPGWQSSVTPHCLRSVSLRSQANLVYSSISGEHEYHYHYKRFYTWPLKRSQSAWLTQLLCVVILYSVFIQFDCQWLVQFNFHCLLLVKNWRTKCFIFTSVFYAWLWLYHFFRINKLFKVFWTYNS